MVIQTYFAQVKTLVDEYTAASFVLEASVNFDIRPGNQGYLAGSMTFLDNSALYFKEFIDIAGEAIDKLMYSYHYQDAAHQLIFRYDNARHQPPLASAEHKHLPEDVITTPAPTLADILTEIVATQGWV
ncbi:MAG: hypothetical protein Fur0044_16740 [Anaerolineae bacterium]